MSDGTSSDSPSIPSATFPPIYPPNAAPAGPPSAPPAAAPAPAATAFFFFLPFEPRTAPTAPAPIGPPNAPPSASGIPSSSFSSLTSSGKTLISFLLLTPSPVIFFSSLSFFSIKSAKPSLQEYSSLRVDIALPIALRRFIRYLSLLSFLPSLLTSPSSLPTGSNPCFTFAVDEPLYFSDLVGAPYSVISTDETFGLLRSSLIFERDAILT